MMNHYTGYECPSCKYAVAHNAAACPRCGHSFYQETPPEEEGIRVINEKMREEASRKGFRELEAKEVGQRALFRVMIVVMSVAMIGLAIGYTPFGRGLPNWWGPAQWLLLAIGFRVLARSAWAKLHSRGYRLIVRLAMISNACVVAAVVAFIW